MNALEQNIMQALAGNPRVNPDEISVQAFGGDVALRGTVGSVVQREEAVRTTRHVTVRGDAVTVAGTVRSRADHDTALTAAAAAPGVTDVHDEIRVAG